MKILIIAIFCLAGNSVSAQSFFQSTYLSEKPKEIESFEEIFSKVLQSKKNELLRGYTVNSKLVQSEFYERVYAIANENCSVDPVFLGELFRTEVENITQELLVYRCNQREDGVNFYRTGKSLSPLDSQALLHLNSTKLIEQDVLNLNVGEFFGLEIQSFDLELVFRRLPEGSKELVIQKKYEHSTSITITLRQTKYYTGEIRWEFNIVDKFKSFKQRTEFLTISNESPYHEGIYSHVRYFNNKKVDSTIYLEHFEELKELMGGMAKPDARHEFSLPVL